MVNYFESKDRGPQGDLKNFRKFLNPSRGAGKSKDENKAGQGQEGTAQRGSSKGTDQKPAHGEFSRFYAVSIKLIPN